MEQNLSFRTLKAPCGPSEYRDRKSKFLGYAYPVNTTSGAQELVDALWREHPGAAHICYAYRIGVRQPEIRMQDDGEPANSSAPPIFGQIESYDLHNVLVCVVRYYGGVKLGVGGLIQAYREAAKSCLELGRIEVRRPSAVLVLRFTYDDLDAVLRIVDQQRLRVVRREMALSCRMDLEIPLSDLNRIREVFGPLPEVSIEVEERTES
ncbi:MULTISPECIES: IMPACT family protein [unclassified Robiginitalea]|uniref:IMPACT family protein n=1 Tax=Robiginitalea TaxID=252306 RepID=UPI00234BDB5A|nr:MULTISPECIES: YigZ family protein [unclassified Robiginitalea]MDC6354287.1 YigZ family protein [Robiginitalea sp. PM2]MDC6374554.1 YigZ family protein [Robiginitalea sp. SP8]